MVVQYEISNTQKERLDQVFYGDKVMSGRDRLFAYVTEHYPEAHLTQQVGRHLMSQSIWQTSLKPNRSKAALRNQKYILVNTDP